MVTSEFKKQVINRLKEMRNRYATLNAFASSLKIDKRHVAQLLQGEGVKMNDLKWVDLAHKIGLEIHHDTDWKTAETPTLTYITGQMRACQEYKFNAIFSDKSGIGKTHSALYYQRNNKDVIYVDCSRCKSRAAFLRQIAKKMGLKNGVMARSEMFDEIELYTTTTSRNLLVILDEVGDLEPSAWLDVKALLNATKDKMGWYLMGASGLQKKINGNIERERVGDEEIFSRLGAKFQSVMPQGKEDQDDFLKAQMAMVVATNDLSGKIQEIYAASGGNLRRAELEVKKYKNNINKQESNKAA